MQLAVLALGALLLAWPAHAFTAGPAGSNIVSINGYCYNVATQQLVDCTTGAVLTQERDKDRDYSVILNGGIIAQTLAHGKTVQALAAIDVSKYRSLTIMLSYSTAAAADSDSIVVGVKAYAKQSSNPADGLNYVMSPTVALAAIDTSTIVLPGGVLAIPRLIPHTFIFMAPNKVGQGGVAGGSVACVDGTTARLCTFPLNRIRLVQGQNAACARLDVQSQYILFEVSNMGLTDLSNVTVNIWPKVN